MKVTLIAHTTLSNDYPSDPTTAAVNQWLGFSEPTSFADFLAEFAGRACYQSFNRPNPETAANEDYLANILRQEHFSVLEHASATFYIQGISRSLTHELVRHRHLSFSQLSQRFVDAEKDFEVVHPPAVRSDPNLWSYDAAVEMAREAYKEIYQVLRDKDLSVKQAREAARAVLPNMIETKIVVTGNHRAWRDFLLKRLSPAADAEIRELAVALLNRLRQIAPNTYQDFSPDSHYLRSEE